MESVFRTVLVASLCGTATAGLLHLAKPLTQKHFSADWHYFVRLFLLVIMAIPIPLTLPQTQRVTTAVLQTAVVTVRGTAPPTSAPIQAEPTLFPNLFSILSHLWLAVALLLLGVNLVRYLLFLHRICRNAVKIACPELSAFTDRSITVKSVRELPSPMVLGIFRPTLLLPDTPMTEEELRCILAHESIHLRRHNILCKWLIGMVKCLHWFNPCIRQITDQTALACEIACDCSAVKTMSEPQKQCYLRTILTMVQTSSVRSPLWMGAAAESKNALKQRFLMIKRNLSVSPNKRRLSVVLGCLTLLLTVFLIGTLTAPSEPDEPSVSVTVQEDTAPSPSAPSEPPEPSESSQSVASKPAAVKPSATASVPHTRTESSQNESQPQQQPLVQDLSSPHTEFRADENGSITLAVSTDTDTLLQVAFYDGETHALVQSCTIPSNTKDAYTFLDLEAEKTYDITIQSKTADDWNISGTYTLY